MHSRPLNRPFLLTTLALLTVASFGAAPAFADDDHRGRGHGYHRDRDRHDHHHHHGRSGFGIHVVIGGGHAHAPHPAPGHGPHCRYIPAHYETRSETVCVAPARVERRWCEPRYEVRYDHRGRRFSVCVSSGHWDTVHIPARYETRSYQVHVPAQWVCSDGCGYAHATGHHRY